MASRKEGDVPEDANEHCPGVESEQAGKASACEGCPNQNICASKPKGPDPDIEKINERLQSINHKILVLSGKGGVGKSTISAQLAFAFANIKPADEDDEFQYQVGLLDVDICGPSIPRILGLEGEEIHESSLGWSPVYPNDNFAVMSVGFLLNDPSQAVIWRGPKKNDMIKRFIKDVYWNEIDYLFIDTPPGTTDEHLSLVQFLKNNNNVDGAIIVTTPQEVSLADVRKEISFCKKLEIPIIGVVENMSTFVCPKCHKESVIFKGSTGGAASLESEMGVKLIGKVPLDPILTRACDEGKNFLEEFPHSLAATPLMNLAKGIEEHFKTKQ